MRYFLPLICLSAPLCAVDQSALSYTIIQDQYTIPILTPSLAKRETEKLILENGCKVLLISDKETPQSSAGLCVGSGSWDDDHPGMAHFVEHMLFMGTEAYPDESEYMQFVKDHGGKVNAYTAPDRTVYMFSIHNDAYPQAIDRLSHFLSILYSPQVVYKESLTPLIMNMQRI